MQLSRYIDWNKKEVAYGVLRARPDLVLLAPEQIQQDPVALALVLAWDLPRYPEPSTSMKSFLNKRIPERLLLDLSFAKLVLGQNGKKLEVFPEAIRNNKEVVLEALKSCPAAVEFVSKRLREDPEVREAATPIGSETLPLPSNSKPMPPTSKPTPHPKLKAGFNPLEGVEATALQDKEVCLSALEIGCLAGAWESIPEELWKDREFCLKAVAADSRAIGKIKDYFPNDQEIFRIALAHNARNLYFAGEEILRNKELVLSALNNENLSPKIGWEAKWGDWYGPPSPPREYRVGANVPQELLCDGEVALAASIDRRHLETEVWKIFREIPPQYRDNKAQVIEYVSQVGGSLKNASNRLRSDPDVVDIAKKSSVGALIYAYPDSILTEDRSTIELAPWSEYLLDSDYKDGKLIHGSVLNRVARIAWLMDTCFDEIGEYDKKKRWDCPELEQFPLDFQLFVKLRGYGSFGTRGVGIFNWGFPVPVEFCDENLESLNSEDICSRFHGPAATEKENILVIGDDNVPEPYWYNISVSPFQFGYPFEAWGTFLDFVEDTIVTAAEY